MKFEKWQIPTVSAEAVRRLTEAGYPYLVSAVLVSRGITTAADAAAFLAQEHSLIYDPRLMRDMDRAVGRISRALADGDAETLLRRRFRLVCTRGVDGTPRTLYGFMPDSIVYTDGKKQVRLDAYLAVTPQETGFCGFEGIAHPSAIA